MAAYLSLTHTDTEATPFLLTPPDLIRGGRYLRNNMDLAVHTAIHSPLHFLSCAINDPWGLRHLHPPSRYLFENSFSNFPTLPPFFLYDSRRTSPVARFFDKPKGSAPAFAGALPLRFFQRELFFAMAGAAAVCAIAAASAVFPAFSHKAQGKERGERDQPEQQVVERAHQSSPPSA